MPHKIKPKNNRRKSPIKIPPVPTPGTARELMSLASLKKNAVNRREQQKKTRAVIQDRKTNRRSKGEKFLGAGHQVGKK